MAVRPIANASFEDGNSTGWEIPGGIAYVVGTQDDTPFGTMSLRFTTGSPGEFRIHSEEYVPVAATKKITASCNYSQGPASAWRNTGQVILSWYDAAKNRISESPGTLIYSTGANGSVQARNFALSTVTAEAPTGAEFVRIGLLCNKDRNDWCNVDNFVWDYQAPPTGALVTSPTGAGIYQQGTTIPFRASYALPDGITVVSMKYIVTDVLTSTVVAELVPPTNVSPWAVNNTTLVAGEYKVVAQFTLNTTETVTTPEVLFRVGDPVPPTTREYRASNAGTNLVMENFSGIASAIPSTALVTGAELLVDYELTTLSRTLDRDVAPSAANPDTVFSLVPSGMLEATLLDKSGTSYSVVGAPMTTDIPINRSDFTLTEEGTSEGKKWAVFNSNLAASALIGSKNTLFGSGVIAVQDFLNKSIGLKFTTVAGSIPSYAQSGDACVRIKFNSVRLRVYFDAGSVEYYFKSPTGEVIKGTLVSANVLSGDLRNGDASGVLQLSAYLDLGEAGQYNRILDGWTIHTHYPATDDNMIGVVEGDMKYNALPSYPLLALERTRTEIITANFYGDERLNSMYGVNGVDRAFSYNGEDFYKIYTQPDPDKDKPRHLAFHHTHLALGYQEGRVDISVVGEPFNFDGVKGASSWGVGDGVTGMLTLSGTILGVFGSSSVTGISGTTVDNFATQTISPKMGAIEYTVIDMGYPVYANSYGIYTLGQIQQYGDYLGTPMSQDISPWLRPRLVRKDISEKEVVAAWPVRSKNQYRLAFADGAVLTMTVNNGQQSAPTFSKQKYYKTGQTDAPVKAKASMSFTMYQSNANPDRYSIELPPGWRLPTDPGGNYLDVRSSPDNSYAWYATMRYTPDGNPDFPWLVQNADPQWDNLSMPFDAYIVAIEGETTIVDSALITVRKEGDIPAPVIVDMYGRDGIVPAAISSQIDDGGEERIHIAEVPEPTVEEVIEEEMEYKLVCGSSPNGRSVTMNYPNGQLSLDFTDYCGYTTYIVPVGMSSSKIAVKLNSFEGFTVESVQMYRPVSSWDEKVVEALPHPTSNTENWRREFALAEPSYDPDVSYSAISKSTTYMYITVNGPRDAGGLEYMYVVKLRHPSVEGAIYAVGKITLDSGW